jgi:hypothetical protein
MSASLHVCLRACLLLVCVSACLVVAVYLSVRQLTPHVVDLPSGFAFLLFAMAVRDLDIANNGVTDGFYVTGE